MMNRCYHSCLSAAEITTQHVHILPAAARVTSTSVSEDNGNIFFQMNLWWKQIVGGIDMDIIDAACWCSQWLLPWLHRWNQIYPAHLIELFNNNKTGGIVVCSGVGSRNNNGIRGFRGSLTFYLVWQPCNPWKCLPCSGCDPSWPFVVAVAIVLSIKSLRPACTVLLPSKLNMKLVLVSKRLWHNFSTPPPPPPPPPLLFSLLLLLLLLLIQCLIWTRWDEVDNWVCGRWSRCWLCASSPSLLCQDDGGPDIRTMT